MHRGWWQQGQHVYGSIKQQWQQRGQTAINQQTATRSVALGILSGKVEDCGGNWGNLWQWSLRWGWRVQKDFYMLTKGHIKWGGHSKSSMCKGIKKYENIRLHSIRTTWFLMVLMNRVNQKQLCHPSKYNVQLLNSHLTANDAANNFWNIGLLRGIFEQKLEEVRNWFLLGQEAEVNLSFSGKPTGTRKGSNLQCWALCMKVPKWWISVSKTHI